MKRKIFSSEHESLRESVKDFITKEILPQYEEWESGGCVPREMWEKAGRMGWLCPEAEAKWGGMESDLLFSLVIGEELNFHSVPSFFIPLHNDIVFPYLQKFASDEQKDRWVAGCLSGKKILALALTEPDVGSDLAQLKTRAVREGDFYVVNGSKTFISNGQLADLVIVAVRTDSQIEPAHRGLSLLVVEAGTPGFSRGRNLKKLGLHAQDTSELFFENCKIPVGNLLGAEGQGFKYMMQNLQQERLVLAVGGVAHARGALNETVKYVGTREVFGKSLAKFQNTRFKLAEMTTQVCVAQSFVDDLIVRHVQGESLIKEVSMAKYFVSEIQFQVADTCLQLFGGQGYMQECPISRYFMDARVQRIYGGTNEIMKEIIAREILGPL